MAPAKFTAMASHDPDFENLRKEERFIEMLEVPTRTPPVYIDTRPSLSEK